MSLLLTGLPPGEQDAQPIPALAPEVTDTTRRVEAVARIYQRDQHDAARKRALRTGGKPRLIQLRSAIAAVHIIVARHGRLVEQVDARYVRPLPGPRGGAAQLQYVDEFITERVHLSTTTASSQWVLFQAWMTLRDPVLAPKYSRRTFERLCGRVYAVKPWLRLRRAKSRASAHERGRATFAARLVERPGEVWLTDTTTSNVALWDPFSDDPNRETFRPELTCIVDRATVMIVGWSVTVFTSAFAVTLALAKAHQQLTDDRYSKTVDGVVYPVPYVGFPRAMSQYPFFPESIVTDNGKPFLSPHTVAQAQRLHADFEPARSFSPADKSQMERKFGSFKTLWEQLQRGFTGGAVDEKGDAAHAAAVLTIQEYLRRVEEFIDLWNYTGQSGARHPGEPGRFYSPYELWCELARQIGPAEVPAWENETYRYFPAHTVKVDAGGAAIEGLLYQDPILQQIIDTPGASPDGRLTFYRNPNDVRQVYLFDPTGDVWEVPWRGRNPETPQFGDDYLAASKEAKRGLPRAEFERILIANLVRDAPIDDQLARLRLLSRSERMETEQIRRLLEHETGVVHTAQGSVQPVTAVSAAGIGTVELPSPTRRKPTTPSLDVPVAAAANPFDVLEGD